MSETCELEIEAEAKTHPDKFYSMIKYTLHHLPAVFPEIYKSSEIIEGDGNSVGTVRLWKNVLPGSSGVSVGKETILEVDDQRRFIAISVLEGDLMKEYKRFVIKMHVNAKGDGSVVKWSLEYQKAKDDVPDPHLYLEVYSQINQKLDAHLLKA